MAQMLMEKMPRDFDVSTHDGVPALPARKTGRPQTGLPGRKSPNSTSPARRPPKPCRPAPSAGPAPPSACPLGLGLPPARVRLTDTGSHLPSDCPALGDFRRLYSFSRCLSRKNRSTSVDPRRSRRRPGPGRRRCSQCRQCGRSKCGRSPANTAFIS
jgi:hypothetical protein